VGATDPHIFDQTHKGQRKKSICNKRRKDVQIMKVHDDPEVEQAVFFHEKDEDIQILKIHEYADPDIVVEESLTTDTPEEQREAAISMLKTAESAPELYYFPRVSPPELNIPMVAHYIYARLAEAEKDRSAPFEKPQAPLRSRTSNTSNTSNTSTSPHWAQSRRYSSWSFFRHPHQSEELCLTTPPPKLPAKVK
jgi:hypothetical protein